MEKERMAARLLQRLKEILSIEADSDLGKRLSVNATQLVKWRMRNAVPACLEALVESELNVKITVNDQQLFPLDPVPASYTAFVDSIREASLKEKRQKIGVVDVLHEVITKAANVKQKSGYVNYFTGEAAIYADVSVKDQALKLMKAADEEAIAYAINNKKDFIKQLKKISTARKVLLG
ncbi:hypothetical protein FACS1894103_2070 [Campylobacterota bacterium]|nr:hypothetical protein FACS1894103_2070 [Campylobacterota bacterium]